MAEPIVAEPGKPAQTPEQQQQRVEAERRLANLLWNDPETGPEMRKLVEKVAPGSLPMAEMRQAAERERAKTLEEVRKEREEWKREREAEMQSRSREAAHQKLKSQGYSDGDIERIEKLMIERLTADYEVAANYYKTQNQVGTPRSSSLVTELPGIQGAGGDYFVKAAGGGPGIGEGEGRSVGRQWALKRAYKDLEDLKAGRPLDPAPWDVQQGRQ